MGLMQPFSDALKLFFKTQEQFSFINFFLYYLSPLLILTQSLLIWLIFPKIIWSPNYSFSLILILCLISFGVYPVLMIGLSVAAKYRILGRIRAIAQVISYEITFILRLLIIIYINKSFYIKIVFNFPLIFLCIPLGLIFFISTLAEASRSPFDLTEGESELVSGFNTEFIAGLFVFIFIAEYSRLLRLNILLVILFGISKILRFLFIQVLIFTYIFIWLRGTIPRIRYDILINLSWKIFLGLTLILILYRYTISSFLMYLNY